MQETAVQSLGQEDPWRKDGLPFSCLENSIDRGAAKCSQDFEESRDDWATNTFTSLTYTTYPLKKWREEKEMATHSSIFAWKIPWTEELGGLQSIVLQSQTRLSTHTPCPHPRLLLFLIRLLATAGTTFGTSSSSSSGLPWRCCWCLLGNPDASASQRSPGRAQGSSRWPCTRFAPGLAPMWSLRLLHVTFSVEASSALLLSWGSPLWKRSLCTAELCWSLQRQDAFSPKVCGSQLPNEAYLIKELALTEKNK